MAAIIATARTISFKPTGSTGTMTTHLYTPFGRGLLLMTENQITTQKIDPSPSPKIDELVSELIANLVAADNAIGHNRLCFIKQALRVSIKIESELVAYADLLRLQARHLRQFDGLLPLKNEQKSN